MMTEQERFDTIRKYLKREKLSLDRMFYCNYSGCEGTIMCFSPEGKTYRPCIFPGVRKPSLDDVEVIRDRHCGISCEEVLKNLTPASKKRWKNEKTSDW